MKTEGQNESGEIWTMITKPGLGHWTVPERTSHSHFPSVCWLDPQSSWCLDARYMRRMCHHSRILSAAVADAEGADGCGSLRTSHPVSRQELLP